MSAVDKVCFPSTFSNQFSLKSRKCDCSVWSDLKHIILQIPSFFILFNTLIFFFPQFPNGLRLHGSGNGHWLHPALLLQSSVGSSAHLQPGQRQQNSVRPSSWTQPPFHFSLGSCQTQECLSKTPVCRLWCPAQCLKLSMPHRGLLKPFQMKLIRFASVGKEAFT